ncbi:MAG TPA: EAL domain-containing protein [Phycisphaerae bacterium]|nr:EAL domain-containing protein [Phycisphaerae bacterium]
MSQEDKNRRILIIDDNRAIHDDFHKILAPKDAGALDDLEAKLFGQSQPAPQRIKFGLDSAYQGQEGLELVRRAVETGQRYALAFVDMRMPPGWDGLQTIEKIWEVDPDIQIVICTAYSDYSWEEISKKFGSGDRLLILKKPFDTVEVCQLACALTEKWYLARHAHLKLNQLNSMVLERTRELEITNQKLLDEIQQRKESEERYRLAETGVNDGLWDWDLVADKIYFSTRWKSMLGYCDSEIGDSPGEWLGRVHKQDLPRLLTDQKEHFEGLNDQLRGEYRIQHKDGQYRWILCRGVVVRDANNRVIRAAGSFTDITDRKMAEEQLRHEALHDGLTGLANRSRLMDRISHCLARTHRNPESRFAVLFMDLDRFKVINDSLGHPVGDKFLIEIGRRLTALIRENDTLARPAENHVARIGGDEFVLVLEDIQSETDALRVADRVQQALIAPFNINGHEICTFVSIGVAIGVPGYKQSEDILRDADTAMYQAKIAGKACTRLFDPEMHSLAMKRWQIETELRHAIENNELQLHYQPIFSTDGRLVSLEALLRWQHPTQGLLPPGEFISIAEETSLIIPIGRWVMLTACRQLREWQKQFPELSTLSVGINVSGKQFVLPTFVYDVANVLAESGLPANCLRLEITETVAMQNAEFAIRTLVRLHTMGVKIDVDDFGTGYSSLSYLHSMPIDTLKIDRSFISLMDRDTMSCSIVQAIMALAHSLNIEVVAEGVECEFHLDALRKMGSDYVQGYYISKPLPLERATEFISASSQNVYRSNGSTNGHSKTPSVHVAINNNHVLEDTAPARART